MSVTYRPATADDHEFLADMLVEAFNWHPERDWSRERVLALPDAGHYVTDWPRPGDMGVVAEHDGVRAGAAWLRYFPADDPGYGFVAADVPELGIGVVAERRGQGIGRGLLRTLFAMAAEAGIERISLSVERANFAHALYLAEGFEVVAHDTDSDTMLRSVNRDARYREIR